MASCVDPLTVFLGLDVPTSRTLAPFGPLVQALARERKLPSTFVCNASNPAHSPARKRIAGAVVVSCDKPWIVRARSMINTMIMAVSAPICDAEGLLVAFTKFDPAFRDIENHGGIFDKQRLIDILAPVRDAVRVAKNMVRQVEALHVTKKMLRQMRTLLIEASTECHAALSGITTKPDVQGYWPKEISAATKALQEKTTVFASKLVVTTIPLPSPSTDGVYADAFYTGKLQHHITVRPNRLKRAGSHATDGTANLSGRSLDTSPRSNSSSFGDGFWPCSGSEASDDSEASSLRPEVSATANKAAKSRAFSPREGREQKFVPRKASISPAALFVARRPARQLANPRGTSLGGTGAVVIR